jgi:hypothetical protein
LLLSFSRVLTFLCFQMTYLRSYDTLFDNV